MNQKKILGRGLNSLIPQRTVGVFAKPVFQFASEGQILKVPVDKVFPNPKQPRKDFGHQSLEELINSIREHGIIQPLIVVEAGDGYELIAGERRLRSAKILGLKTVPVIVRKAKEQEKLELALIENIQRQNLNPIEEAVAYQRLIDEFSLTQEEAAKRVGKSRSVVANALRLLVLPEEIQKALMENKIYEGHAKVLAGLPTAKEQLAFFRKIMKSKLTVGETEKTVKENKPESLTKPNYNPGVKDKEDILRRLLGTKVKIEERGGKGKISIDFYSLEELNNIIKKINK